MKNRILSKLIVLIMALTMVIPFSLTASAEQVTATEDTIKTVGVYDIVIPKYADIPDVGGITPTEVKSTDSNWVSGWYVATGTTSIGNTVNVTGDVSLILADGCNLTVTAEADSAKAGIHVATGSSLTIYGQEKGNGKLTAYGKTCVDSSDSKNKYSGAGIGCDGGKTPSDESCGIITINGGIIKATGSTHGAGIGGGYKGDANNITINGGTVTAQGGGNAAAIGGGSAGDARNLTINGGTVTAKGGSSAAGIGAGKNGNESDIKIDKSLFIKSSTASNLLSFSTAFHFSSADDTDFNIRYLKISPEICEIEENNYGFFEDVISAAEGGEKTIKLLRDLNLTSNYVLPSNTTFALNNHNFTVNSNIKLSGDNISFDINSDKDMETVNALNKSTSKFDGVIRIRVPDNQTWNINADIKTKSTISVSKLKDLTINGNGKEIDGDNDEAEDNYIMSFTNGLGFVSPSNVTVNNITFKTNNEFEKCIYVQSSKADSVNKRANVTFNNVTFNNNTCYSAVNEYQGACIVNNWGDVTLKGSCEFITGEKSYSAIDLTKTCGDATLTFDSDAVIKFDNGCAKIEKTKEPLIGFDVDTTDDNYVSSANWTVVGYASQNIGLVESLRGTKEGYDLPVCEVSNVKYGSISKALKASETNVGNENDATNPVPTVITMTADDTEHITIPEGRNIILNINGHVLEGDGTGSVITNNGTLIITDSNISAKHYFKYSKTGAWTIDTSASSGINISDITGSTVDNTIIEVTGGVITGGKETNNTKCGGAIFNHGTLTLQSGNIIGNTSERGGAVYNCMGYEMTMDGGLIAGNTSTNAGSGVNVPIGSKFTMNGGKIMNNTVVNNECGAVYVVGTFIMNDGEISNNKAKSGAGVYVYFDNTNPGTFRMNGGTIKNNTASDKGGGVYVDNYADVLLKGKIENNTAGTLGGGVCCNSPITVGGSASITGNTVKGHANNVFLRVASKSDFSPLINFDSSLAANASIGVSVDKAPLDGDTPSPVQFASVSDIDYSACFTSDNGAYSVVYKDTTDINDLKLKQTTFYVIDNVVNNGNDTTGNGTSAKPYATIQKAAEMANGTGVVKLLSGIDFTKNETLPDNTTIMINGKDIRPHDYTLTGSNITVLIYNSDDFTAASALLKCLTSTSTCTFKLMNNIEISDALKLHGNIGNVTFDGNGKTISASSTSETSPYVFSIQNGETETRNFTLKNATLNVNNGFRYGIYLEGKNGNINATTEDVTINMNQTIAPKKNGVNKTTAIIMDNGADLTIKGNFIANTNEFCWTAINLDASNRNISLTFDDSAVVSISDYRTDEYKASKMLIAFDGNTTNACTASGKYKTDNLGAIGTKGYNPLVTVTFDSNGGSVVDAKTTAQYWYVGKPADPTYKGYSFGGWYSDTACENAWDFENDKVTEDKTLYAKWTANYNGGLGVGGAAPTKTPVVSADTGATYELTDNSSKLTITVKEGYELVDVTVNGKSKGAISIVTGLKNGDNVVISTKKATSSEISQKDVSSMITDLAIRVNTKYVKKNGKKCVQAYTDILSGNEELQEMLNNGYTVKYEFYRGTEKKSGALKKVFTTSKSKYTNTKGTSGKRYYYRAVLKVYDTDGALVASTKLSQCKYGTRVFK